MMPIWHQRHTVSEKTAPEPPTQHIETSKANKQSV